MYRTKQYRPWQPDQCFLLPPSPHDWLEEDDLAYFVLELVSALDLSGIESAIHGKDSRGNRPYHPRMMTGLLVYGYCTGVVSSRQLERATYRDVAFRVIAGGAHPDHTAISEFRRRHLKCLQDLFVQTVRLAQRAGLVKLGRVGLDGTKVKASASKHKAMSYERMLKSEAVLRQEIAELLEQAEQADLREDRRFGRGRRGDELPEELRRRERRLAVIQRAKAELEAEARLARVEALNLRVKDQQQKAASAQDTVERKRAQTRAAKSKTQAADLLAHEAVDESSSRSVSLAQGLPHHRVPTTPEGEPKPRAQRNFTDPDSRIMKRDGAYLQAYNCQAAVDDKQQIVVGCAATNQPPDQEHLPPLVEQVQRNCGAYPKQLLADAGYWKEEHVAFCEQRSVDPYIATGRLRHGEARPSIVGRAPANMDAKARMRRKLATKRGREIYAHRKVLPEPVFGQMRTRQGLQQFRLRGLEKVRAEWALFCACHNVLKLYRARSQPG